MNLLPSRLRGASQAAKSAALVLCGVAGIARGQLNGEAAILTFHGLRADGVPSGVWDESLHLPVSTFRAIATQLASRYQVLPLTEMAAILQAGEKLPPRAVALTFDDGYASNYELAFPILSELGLPATIFLTTGFVDGTHPLWFQEVDRSMNDASGLQEALTRLKKLPDDEMRLEVQRRVHELAPAKTIPAVTRALSWNQVREMQKSGLICFGGHTHTHPILARCTPEQQREEIQTCRDRIQAELGQTPRLFAFPNGGPGDFTETTVELLKEAGFQTACTMINGRLGAESTMLQWPRYGSPESLWEAEATVSGAFELVRRWRGGAA